MIKELFAAAKDELSYQKILTEVVKGLSKEQLKLLPSYHPTRAMMQQWGKSV